MSDRGNQGSLITEQGSDLLIGRQMGIGGDQFGSPICLKDRLHHGFPEFDGGDLATTECTLEMGLCREGTTATTAPTLEVKLLV